MAGEHFVNVDIEVVTPQRKEELRRLGVALPTGSGTLGDPRQHSDFIDNRLTAVGYGIYVGGYHLYVTGVALPVLLPNVLVDLSARPALAIGPEIYDSLDAAKEAVRLVGPLPAGPPADTVRFAYWRAYGGLVLPSVFSDVTAPRTLATARLAMSDLAQQVTRDLTATALSLMGTRILSAAYSKLMRAVSRWGGQPVRLPGPPGETMPPASPGTVGGGTKPPARPGLGATRPATPAGEETPPLPPGAATTPPAGAISNANESAVALGKRIGESIKSLSSGKRSAIARQISAKELPPTQAAAAAESASTAAFGANGGTVRLPNGDLVVTPAKIGMELPVFVVRPNGQVLLAKADIEIAVPMNKTNPLTIKNVIKE